MRSLGRLGRHVSGNRLGILGIVVVTAAIAFPLGAIASHQFSDVPNTSTYHNDIDAIADAGVTTGCGNGTTYCPSAFVTREQMAAFMNRLGALGAGKTPVVNATKLDGLDSTAFVGTATVSEGSFNCPGITMVPDEDDRDWHLSHDGKYFEAGSGSFVCPVQLPDGATVTGVAARIFDVSIDYEGSCALARYTAGVGSYVGQTAGSGVGGQPGHVTINATSLTNTLVDNDLYVYVGSCALTGATGNLAVFGLTVTFEVTGLPVS